MGGDQLCPQRLPVGVFECIRPQTTSLRWPAHARFRPPPWRAWGRNLVFYQRAVAKGFDERKSRRSSTVPFTAGGVAAGLFRTGGGGAVLYSFSATNRPRSPAMLSGMQAISSGADQHHPGSIQRHEELTQIRHTAGGYSRVRPRVALPPEGGD